MTKRVLENIKMSHWYELIDKHGPDAAIDMPEHYMHTLTRCMGQDIDFDVDIGEIEVKPGCSILICSDGVTNMVSKEEIEEILLR